MGLTAKDSGGKDFDPVAQGMHHAICYGLYDLGTHFSEKFGKSSRKVLLQWELPNSRIDIDRDGEMVNLPRAISKQYTLSLHEKSNLRKDLESWRGKTFTKAELEGFNVQKLLGINCTIQVLHRTKDDRTYANVGTIVPLMTGNKQEPENPIRFFSFEEESDIPEGTPDWIIDIIEDSKEWKMRGDGPPEGFEDGPEYDDSDEIPF